MRALFDDDKIPGFSELFPDLGELGSQQFSKDRTNADVGKIIALPPDGSATAAVITVGWMIESLFHEPGERDRPVRADSVADQFDQRVIGVQRRYNTVPPGSYPIREKGAGCRKLPPGALNLGIER